VCNTGSCNLQVTSAAVGYADFTLINDPFPATVSPDSCLDLVVRFTPLLPGKKSCGLVINSDDPDTPVVVRTLTARTPPALSLHSGLVDPYGHLGSTTKQGSTFGLIYLQPFSPQWAWDARLALARFDGKPGQDDVDLITAGAEARFTFNPAAPLRIFLNGGLGIYHFDPGDVEGGLSLGLGLAVSTGDAMSLELTYDYHLALTASPDLEYGQLQLGAVFYF